MATAAPRAVVLPAAQERRPPGPSRKEIVSAQQERRNFGRRLREGVDPMDPVRILRHHLHNVRGRFSATHCEEAASSPCDPRRAMEQCHCMHQRAGA